MKKFKVGDQVCMVIKGTVEDAQPDRDLRIREDSGHVYYWQRDKTKRLVKRKPRPNLNKLFEAWDAFSPSSPGGLSGLKAVHIEIEKLRRTQWVGKLTASRDAQTKEKG